MSRVSEKSKLNSIQNICNDYAAGFITAQASIAYVLSVLDEGLVYTGTLKERSRKIICEVKEEDAKWKEMGE